MSDSERLVKLQTENARLIALLESHGIEWQSTQQPITILPLLPTKSETSKNTLEDRISIFRALFRGRADVYPIRWESKKTGKSGYAPACANEWKVGVCEKPKIKCSECSHRILVPLSNTVIYDHLIGNHTIGIYPMLPDDSCYFLAVDFDKGTWREDVLAFAQSGRELNVPVAIEISRSGNGAHAWIFFSDKISAHDARLLGATLISHTCNRIRQLELTSYDRFIPNQDTMPKGGFGNLIALPLQREPRNQGHSVFVDDQLNPYPDQWIYLSSIQPITPIAVGSIISQAAGQRNPLDITLINEANDIEPWQQTQSQQNRKLDGSFPSSLTATLANMLYFEKDPLPQSLINRLIRLAAFQNPEFYKAQAMRMSVWNTPRIISCVENFPKHIALPRGCLEAVQLLLGDNGITLELRDERTIGSPIDVAFTGTLREEQRSAVNAMLVHDIGVLCAPTAFGKTVIAASIISARHVNTLILVHRAELLKQWQERLQTFLGIDKTLIGSISGGKFKVTGRIDIALMQSLSRQGEVNALVENYGQIIIDECHHIGAVSFESILKQVKAKYILGLTATPIRRDGQQPIIFMQCGSIRHTAIRSSSAPHDLEVIPLLRPNTIELTAEAGIQDVFRRLAEDADRTAAIAAEIQCALNQGRKILVLTERTEHLHAVCAALEELQVSPFVLHGRMSSKQRTTLLETLESLPADAPRVLLASGKLVGEGFDHPPLDTLILAMPISWKGTLQQYAGRLHREHTTKKDVKIIDVVDMGHPALVRMWKKRQQGYKAMGYRIGVR